MPMQAAPEPAAPPVAAVAGAAPRSRPTPSTRVRVLDKKGSYAHVRDGEGNEGWVPADSL